MRLQRLLLRWLRKKLLLQRGLLLTPAATM
jgi:hypothetical protein